MNKSELAIDAVQHVLENFVLQGKEISGESTFRDLGLDSFDKIEVIMDLEDYFDGKHISDECIGELETVNDLIAYVESIL